MWQKKRDLWNCNSFCCKVKSCWTWTVKKAMSFFLKTSSLKSCFKLCKFLLWLWYLSQFLSRAAAAAGFSWTRLFSTLVLLWFTQTQMTSLQSESQVHVQFPKDKPGPMRTAQVWVRTLQWPIRADASEQSQTVLRFCPVEPETRVCAAAGAVWDCFMWIHWDQPNQTLLGSKHLQQILDSP